MCINDVIGLQTNFFLWFQTTHLECSIKQRAFQKVKPYHVQPLKDINVCCYKYHVELNMLKFGLNFLKDSKKEFMQS
jgi:hypothetical protein